MDIPTRRTCLKGPGPLRIPTRTRWRCSIVASRNDVPRKPEQRPRYGRDHHDSRYAYRQRIAQLTGKRRRGREPLDLELIVLFLSIAVILLIPWLLHDARFVLLVPMTFLVVPGLFGVLLKATSEFITIVATSRRKERERQRERGMQGVRGRAGRPAGKSSRSMRSMVNGAVGFVKGFCAFWRGFL